MSSNFSGNYPDFFNQRSIPIMNLPNNINPSSYNPSFRSPLAGILVDPSSQIGLRRPDLMGKRSLAEFQQHQQLQQQAAIFLRNVKPRVYNPQSSPISPLSPMDFSVSPEISGGSNVSSPAMVPRYGVPVFQQFRREGAGSLNGAMGIGARGGLNDFPAKKLPENQDTENKMMRRLQELEKELLLDDEGGENDVISGVPNSEWSETIQTLLGPSQTQLPENTVSPSPTTSSSSSCASSSASPATAVSPKQLISDAAAAISDGRQDAAVETLTRLHYVSNARGTPEQRLSFYMAAALRRRVTGERQPSPAAELFGKEHVLSTQLLYDKSPCFKLAFMAANNTILETVSGRGQPEKRIHVLDFDIAQGLQYVYLLHALAGAPGVAREDNQTPISLKLTTFADYGNGCVERLKIVGDGLKSLSNKLGVCFSFNVLSLKLSGLDTASLAAESGEVLAVNLAFKLYKLPDESVTTENLRDELLRHVKGLSPAVVTVTEQELNANTASFETRAGEAREYYGALLESLDATIPRDSSERVRMEEGLSRRLVNSLACEGRDRVERCEVFGKWRARMKMAGFEPKPLGQLRADSLLAKLNSGPPGNPGFTVKEDSGGIQFGWMGRTLTVTSAWH